MDALNTGVLVMKKFPFKSILIIIICLSILPVLHYALNKEYDKVVEIEDVDTNILYLQVDDRKYPKIDQASASAGLFSQETNYRIDDVYFSTNNCLNDQDNKITLYRKGIFGIRNSGYGYLNVNEDETLYFYTDSRILCVYAQEGFALPDLTSNEIQQIRLEYITSSAAEENGYVEIISDKETINKILSNPVAYFEEYNIADIYVKYNKYNFEERFDENKIMEYSK